MRRAWSPQRPERGCSGPCGPGSTQDEAEVRACGRVWWVTATSAVVAGMAADVGWLVRSEGGWAARVQGEAHLVWVCSFSVDDV
eukprot:scaffold6007_cov63-Phaeocystis_antarctica.AAC.1